MNFLQQQARFDDFIEILNEQRPHQTLDMKYPAEVCQPSTRLYQGLPDIDYRVHDKIGSTTVFLSGNCSFWTTIKRLAAPP